MKALTVSELNNLLKSADRYFTLPSNKWGADYAYVTEMTNGQSYLGLFKYVNDHSSIRVANYANMNAADKKELAEILLSLLKNKQNENNGFD